MTTPSSLTHGRGPALAAALALAASLTACGDGPASTPPTTVSIGPAGGQIAHAGAELVIPAGALEVEVALTALTTQAPSPLPAQVEAAGPVIGFLPHGLAFATPASMMLPYTPGRGGLAVWSLGGPESITWERVEPVTFAAGQARFGVSHLSFYVVTATPGAGSGLVATLTFPELPSMKPEALFVDPSTHELVVFDASRELEPYRPHLRFVAVEPVPADGPAEASGETDFGFELASEAVPIAWTAGIPRGWMAHDPSQGLLYVLAVADRTTDAGLSWEQLWVHVISGRAQVAAFTPNPEGGRPSAVPVDFRFALEGFALRPAHAPTQTPARLFLHDIVGGRLEVLELDATGTALVTQERVSVRPRLESGCSWPPAPPPWDCHWLSTFGNTLAVARQADHDLLYLTDHNASASAVAVLRFSRPGGLVPQRLDDVDLAEAHELFANGIEGLTMAGDSTVYVATGLQSFAQGFIGTIDVATQTPGFIAMTSSDRGDVLVDASDPERAFVAVADAFAENPALLVHTLVGGVVVATTPVLTRYEGGRVSAMAHDAEYDLLYLAVGPRILVVRPDL